MNNYHRYLSFSQTGDPLHCWVPAQFTGTYEAYTNRLCYIQNTYHVPKDEIVPKDYNLRRQRTLKYYQWINFVLLLQALFFSLPRIFWQSFNDKIGLPLGNFVDAANKYDSFDIKTDRQTGRISPLILSDIICCCSCSCSIYCRLFTTI